MREQPSSGSEYNPAYLVTSEEMRELDRHAIGTVGIPAVVLMENAGRAVAEEIAAWMRRRGFERAQKPWLILVGKGNNGGDGLVAARHLRAMGIGAELMYAVPPERLAGEAALQRDIAAKLGFAASVYAPGQVAWGRFAGIVDALLGTGTGGAPREPYASLIREANESGLPIIAVDIPSGLDADTGAVRDPCIRADLTVTLAFCKIGLAQYPGAAYAGEVIVRDIGIPEEAARRHPVRTFLAGPRLFAERFGLEVPPKREADSHKGTYGHVLIVAGSRRFSGAGLLAARAALRGGAGLVTWALPERLEGAVIGKAPEVMLAGVRDGGAGDWSQTDPEQLLRLAEDKDALVAGPGMDRFAGGAAWLQRLWSEARCPLVLDADALNMIAEAGGLAGWPKREGAAILTPHPGEMARLASLPTREVQANRVGLAREYAMRHGVILVLKGARTVTATPAGDVFVNTTGNPGMATGGSGDALAGVIAALLAQGLAAEAAAALGVWLHGAAGDRAAAARPTPASLIAGDIIEAL